jgi:hypothetical protein
MNDDNRDINEDDEYVRLKKTDYKKICRTIVSLKQRITELENLYRMAASNKK